MSFDIAEALAFLRETAGDGGQAAWIVNLTERAARSAQAKGIAGRLTVAGMAGWPHRNEQPESLTSVS